MSIDFAAVWKIASYVVALIVGVYIKQWLERKPKLYFWLLSATGIRIEDPNNPNHFLNPNTHTIVLQNAGRKSATNVRLGHNDVHPFWYQISPSIHYEERLLQGGGMEIVIPALTPKRIINITYFYFAPITYGQVNTHIESDEGMAKLIPMTTQRIFPKWVNSLIVIVMFTGLVALVYLGWELAPIIVTLFTQATEQR